MESEIIHPAKILEWTADLENIQMCLPSTTFFFFAKTSIYVFVVHICKGFLILEINGIKLMNSETRAIIIDDILALLYPKYHWEV